MQDDKYIVIKREDWGDFLTGVATKGMLDGRLGDLLNTMVTNGEVTDAVVLRLQDAMAAPFIAGYATNIALVAEILLNHGESAEAARLMKVADYFQGRYEESLDIKHKLPD
jgi:hypothetical protein